MRVVLLGTYAAQQIARLTAALSQDFEILALHDDASRDEVAAALSEAEVLVTNRYGKDAPPAPKLRLLQSPSAGLEQIDASALPLGCRLLGVDGHEQPMSEYVLCAMLDWCIGFRKEASAFVEGQWNLRHWIKGSTHDELGGKTIGLLGYGRIGQAIANRARAFETTIKALSRWSSRAPDPALDASYAPGQETEFLRDLDFLIVSAPFGPTTAGLVGSTGFEAMKKSAVLINVSRGPVIDEAALYAALANGRIGGAVLDVWYRYPTDDEQLSPPASHPFHTLPNVVMTPHCSGRTNQMFDRRWAGVARNISALARQ